MDGFLMYYFLTGDGTPTSGGLLGMVGPLIMLLLLVVVFYFFMIKPEKKQRKEKEDMLNSLQVGDEITTIGGIIGKVVSIKDETVLIETSKDCTKIRILRTSVSKIDVRAEDAQ